MGAYKPNLGFAHLWSVWDKDDPGVIMGCKWKLINIIICDECLFGLFT